MSNGNQKILHYTVHQEAARDIRAPGAFAGQITRRDHGEKSVCRCDYETVSLSQFYPS